MRTNRKPKTLARDGAAEDANALRKSKPLDLDGFVPFLFTRISNLLYLDSKDDLRRLDLTVPRWRVLATLVVKDGLTIGEIAVKIAMDHASTSRIVKQMEAQKWVRRGSSNKDSRHTAVFLTQAGHDLFDQVRPKAIEQQKRVLASLSAERREVLMEILHDILADIDLETYMR